jgi:hypothetical protein
MIFKSVPKGHPADPFEAFRQLAYSFGVVELAQKMGLRPGTLYNKADADEDTHHQPTLRDVLLSTRLTGDMRVIDALNEAFNRAAFDVSNCAEKSDDALLELFADYGSENGEFCTVIRDALRSRRFRPEDFVLIKEEAMDVVASLMTLVHRLEGLVDA